MSLQGQRSQQLGKWILGAEGDVGSALQCPLRWFPKRGKKTSFEYSHIKGGPGVGPTDPDTCWHLIVFYIVTEFESFTLDSVF